MKKNRVLWSGVVILPLVVILIAMSGRLPAGAQTSSPAELVRRAWANAQDAGSYRFVSDIHETLIPRASPEMIGEQDQSLDLALDGAVMLPDQAYLDLRLAGNQNSGAVTLLRDGQQSFLVQDGQIKPVEDTLSLAAPTNDLLGYLAGADNVTAMEPLEGHPEIARYSFDLDGVRFEEYVRRQAEEALQAEPGAPDEINVSPSKPLQSISGRGELWVNEQGLPVREVLDVEIPEASAAYSARVHMVIDLAAHGLVQSLPHAVQGPDGTWQIEGQLTTNTGSPSAASSLTAQANPAAQAVSALAAAWRSWLSSILPLRVAPSSVALFVLLVLAMLIARYYRRNRRHCYALIVSVLIASMVFSSLLQAGQVVRFADRQARAAAARAEGTPNLINALGLEAKQAKPASTDQEPPAKAETASDHRPPAAALRVPVLPDAAKRAAPARPTLQGTDGETVPLFCGEGEPGVDTDADGLTDQVELCLGTDYQDTDSDDDRISDAIEVQGLDYGGKHWDSDPLKPDSNDDGILDMMEWSHTLTDEGQADSIDQDNDGLPDLWDEDNDNDGVPDALDLSPSAKTDYDTRMDLSSVDTSTGYYEYIEMQVQPEDMSHLRYSTTALDWPYDEQGNVRDLNNWPLGDLRLIPFLLVQTNVRPAEALAEKYGFRIWESDTGGYVLLVPLNPVEQGGEVYAFYAKVAYAPGERTSRTWDTWDITWQAKMVWMTQMQLDSYIYYYLACDQDHRYPRTSGITSETVVVHQYVDSFRLAGLTVTKDLGYEAAVLGTPTSPVEDLELFRLQLGLNQTFRGYIQLEGQEAGETALQEIAQRFAPGTTADLVHTLDVDPTHVGMAGPVGYGHQDAGLAGVGTELVPGYLDTYGGSYTAQPLCEDADGNRFYCASLLTAYEQKLGVSDLRDFQVEQRNSWRCSRYWEYDGQVSYDWCVEWEEYVSWEGLSTNLANTHVFTTRGVQFRMYEQGANEAWNQVTPARMLTFIEQRYNNVYGSALRDYYPDLTIADVRQIAYMAYLTAISPSYAAIAVDGQALVPELADEQQLALDRALDEAFEVDTVVDLIGAGTGIAFAMTGFPQILWAGQDAMRLFLKWALGTTGWNIFNVTAAISFGAATLVSTIMGIINAVCAAGDDRPMCRNEDALEWANVAVDSLAIIAQAQYLIQLIGDLVKSGACSLTKIAVGTQLVGVIIGVTTAWVFFGLTIANSGGDPMVFKYELAYAIASTLWYILLFALNFVPVIGPLIATVLSLLDMIVGFILGLFGIDWDIVAAIIGLWYSSGILTTLVDASFGESESTVLDPEEGMVEGNTFILNLPASGYLQKEPQPDEMGGIMATDEDLLLSWVEGRLEGSEVEGGFAYQEMPGEPRECWIVRGNEDYVTDTLHCNNVASIGYLLEPAVNGPIAFVAKVFYRTVWGEWYNCCNEYACPGYIRDATNLTDGELPEEDEEDVVTLYLDVLPDNVTELWNWEALGNPDRDGDGLTNEQEAQARTDPNLTDSDGDGLSDKYEWETSADLGADPLLADTDGDGLNDRLEFHLGTKINDADSDGDGLTDAEEVRRVEGGALVGGWEVTLPGGTVVTVSSDPLSKDSDGDGLWDSEEKANSLNPNSPNTDVPMMNLRVAPVRGFPGDRAGAYWLPGEDVTFMIEVFNTAAEPVTEPISLLLPGWLDTVAGGLTEGDRTITMVADGNTLSWPLSATSPLQVYEGISMTVTARVDPATTSADSEIALNLLYKDLQRSRTARAVVDGDDPEVAIIAPPGGAYLRGDAYVVGGSARDPTTWIAEVGLSVVPHGSAASYVPLDSTDGPWAYTWELPATDGIYSLQARAIDAMEHEATTGIVDVTVDNTPPEATLSWAMVDGHVHLHGTATDNLAGVERMQIAIDGQSWHSVPLDGTTWAYDWMIGDNAQGDHEVLARAIDRANNESAIVSTEITVDRVAPSSIVNGGADPAVPPAVQANVALNLTGVADEGGHLPQPAAPAVLESGMDVFDDGAIWLGLSGIHDNDGGVLATWIGDFDANRLADLAVGLPGPAGDGGLVAILYGRAGGWPVPPDLEMLAGSEMRFSGVAGAQLGSFLAAAGDANGDSLPDLLIGERASKRAFLIFGSPRPLGEITLDGGQSGSRTMLQAPATIAGLATAGDVDGDGYGDLLIRAGGTAYLIMGRGGLWPATLDVAAEAAATFEGVTGALGVGDVDDDQRFEWVTLENQLITLYGLGSGGAPLAAGTFTTADAEPRAVALGDVDANGYDDWMYSSGVDRILVYGNGTPYTLYNYGGFFAAPGDVDGDRRTDILLTGGNVPPSVGADEVAHLIRHQTGESAPEEFATIEGVGGAANAPYAVGADLNADGSSDLLLIPSETAAEERGFDAPDFSSGFISPQALPLGASSGNAYEAAGRPAGLRASMLSDGPDTRYVDDDAVGGLCDGHSPCYTTIQAAVDASDGGGDTIIVYPGAYASFDVPAGTNYDNLTVQGVNADAVFVEGAGSDAIRVAADGVRLSNLTVRNGTSGVLLDTGAGVPLAAGGPETVIDHLVAHSVQYPIYINEGAALSVTLSTLVGTGADPILKSGATDPEAHTWNSDQSLTEGLAMNGGLVGTASTLYAMPGGTDCTVYAATPGTDGALGTWASAFQVPHEMPAEAGKSQITTGGAYFFQVHPYYKIPDFGTVNGQINAVAVSADGDVYIGGTFASVGSMGAQNIARWDSADAQWHPLGQPSAGNNGVDGTVYALTIVSNGDVYVGGRFGRAFDGTTVPAGNVARWNGSQWLTLGEAVVDESGIYGNGVSDINGNTANATVYALAHTADDVVFVGGSYVHFHESLAAYLRGEGHVYNFSFYHPTRWIDLAATWMTFTGCTVSGTIRDMVWTGGNFFDGTLYAGGSLSMVGFYATNNVGVWDWISGSGWRPMGSGIATSVSHVARNPANGKVYAVSDNAASAGVYEWVGTAWSVVSGATGAGGAVGVDALGNLYAGMVDGGMYVLPAGETALQAIGSETSGIWDLVPDNSGHMLAARGVVASTGGIRRWASAGVDRRDLSGGTWQTIAAPGAMDGAQTPLIAADDAGNLYATWNEVDPDTGWQHAHLYTLPTGSTTWEARGTSPAGTHAIFRKLACAGPLLYAFVGYVDAGGSGMETMFHDTLVYDLATQLWSWGDTTLNLAVDPNASPDLVSMAEDGRGHLFILAPATGASSWVLSRYDQDAGWMAATRPTILTTAQPSAMARVGDYLYAYATPAGAATTNIFRYGAVGFEQRVRANGNVFVLPDTATSGTWRSADSYRFNMQIPAGDNEWVSPSAVTPSPSIGTTTPLTSAQAGFVAPADGLYRLGAGSLVTGGYHQYKAVAHVYTSQAACTACGSGGVVWGQTAFATVREAVESGAERVQIHAGRYPQSFYLVSGVEVLGAGAELAIIEPPAGSAAALVSAEGVAYASLGRVTLAGGALWRGLVAEGGATGLRLARCIIRDLDTGVHLSGGSVVEIVNNTLVRNVNGLLAEGTNPLNVRNTIFAYNTGVGLQRGASSALSVTYNDFYGNGTDMSNPEGSQSSVFEDPRFRSLAGNDLRLQEGSPAIDMGAPNDPTVPGGGERVDIGYAEYDAAGFYVSKDYSEVGENDGLTWGIDAFDRIQPALDAAAAAMHELQGALPEGGYTVGVDAGTYAERVTVPSHVRLIGSGPEVTAIDAGNGGSAVTFGSVIDSELSGFTVLNASSAGAGVEIKDAASGITIHRNVIRNNAGHGISFANKATGKVSFDTVVNNLGAGVYATGDATWAQVRNSILDGNGYGLQAAGSALIRNEYNLLDNTTNVSGVTAGEGTVEADAAFAAGSYYVPGADSPAIDAAQPWADVPLAGGLIADLGYKELIACPLTVVLGPEVDSAVTGNAGVAQVEVGVVAVGDASQPPTATVPSTWSTLTPGTSDQRLYYWTQTVTQATPGLYRVYSRATDAVGNAEQTESDWYEGAFVVDSTAPAITWITTPPATTDAAAVLAGVQTAGTVSTGTGTRYDVEQVYFSVTGPGGTVTYPAEHGRAWIPLPATGSYTINAVAVDEAGNLAQSGASVAVSASSAVATLREPTGTGVPATATTLRGYVRFTAAGNTQVDVSVTGGATVQATLDAPGAQFSAWSANIILPPGDGSKTVTVTPRLGGVAGTVLTLSLTLDTTAPMLSVTAPAELAAAAQGVLFTGTASDAGSGLARVEISVDGGYTWQQATVSGDAWSLNWNAALYQDYVSYPAQVRALDAAGNIALVERAVTLDSIPPSDAEPVTFSQPEGQHLDVVASCTVTWTPPADTGGAVQVLMSADKVADGVPATAVEGTSAVFSFNSAGDWYIHLITQDAAGNQTLRHYGPWHVRNLTASQFNQRRQSIILDGYLDLEHDEWRESELLGIDARSGNPQALYLSMDGQYVFLGWDGAWWALNGVLWAYLDTWYSYGTGTGPNGELIPGGLTGVDRAVEIDGPGDGVLWSWIQDGDHWEWRADPLGFANGPSGGTEARVPFTAWVGHTLRVIALALPPEGGAGAQALALTGGEAATAQQLPGVEPWAVFPTTNPLVEEAIGRTFVWPVPGLLSDLSHLNQGQPTARTLEMDVSSPQSGGIAWCAGSNIDYEILLTNPEDREFAGVTLILTATDGLTYQSVSGATLAGGAPGDSNWTLDVDTLAAEASVEVVVHAHTAAGLSGLSEVASDIGLSGGATELTPGSPTLMTLSHLVDGQAPTVSIDALGGSAILAGENIFTGLASDGVGSGVTSVEVSLDGTNWTPAVGTLAWSVALDIAGSTATLQARAVDGCGLTGTASQVLVVDSTPPEVTWTLPAVITDTMALVAGSATDPAPAGALVARVDVQVDAEGAPWDAASGPYPPDGGVQGWAWNWITPQDDGVVHSLRVRASDEAGNTAVTGWQETIVDTVAPELFVIQQANSVVLPDDPPALVQVGSLSRQQSSPLWLEYGVPAEAEQAPKAKALELVVVLGGTVEDGAGVEAVHILVYDPLGAVFTEQATVLASDWQYVPDVAGWPAGTYVLRVRAADIHGNVTMMGPYALEVNDAPIEGLAAANNGPRMIGEKVTLTASVDGGSNLAYVWDPGDGSGSLEGREVTHIYTAPGEYPAKVTASNSTYAADATTKVTIVALAVEAGVDQLANEGDTVSIAATFVDGRAVEHTATINWGDGTEIAGTVDEVAFTIAGSHVYADNGTYLVTVTLDDGLGNAASDTLQVTVGNVAPTAALDNDGPRDEASAVTLWFKDIVEPGAADILSYSFDWENDGTYDIVDQATSSAQHTWTDDGTYTVKGKIRDDDGGMSEYTTSVIVNNVAPEVNAGDDATIAEGGAFDSSGSFTDPGADTWSATVDYADGSGEQTLALHEDQTFDLSHTYGDNGLYEVVVCVADDDEGSDCDTARVTVNNVAPVVTADPESQTVPYSDAIAEISFTATDVAADELTASLYWSADGTTFQDDPPFAGLALALDSCTTAGGIETCIWKVTGTAGMPEDEYGLRLTVADEDGGTTDYDVTLIVQAEETTVSLDPDNPVAVQVASAGGDSGPFTLSVCVSEADSESPGDISLAQVSMSLEPVGPGGPVAGTPATPSVADGQQCVTFSFDKVPVNTYVVHVTVGGGYYSGEGEDVLVVYDPSLGFTTGGGWFYWPGTANEETGYPGDKTNFGFTMKYNKKATNIQGSLLLIRHLPDDTIYRVKSNALDGLALGEDSSVPMGWASFSGKSTYKEPSWTDPKGNFQFTAYVEDRNEPGTDVDRFWIEVVSGLSLPREAVANAVELGGGNIVVPHKAR